MSALGVHVHHSPSKILGMSHSETLSCESDETVLYPTLGQLAPIVRLLHTLKFLLPRRLRNKNTPKLYSQRCLVEYTPKVMKAGNNLTAQQGSVARAIMAEAYSVSCCVKCT